MKKKLIAVLFVVFAMLMSLTCFMGCVAMKEIKLVDFDATKTEEAVKIGETYELRRLVKDEDGNEYSLSYEVKDSKGKTVSVVANCFEITDKDGYTITYTVTIAENDVRTSVVTLPTRDGDGPAIIFDAPAVGAFGVEYVLPEISFEDLSEIEETSIKVYFVGDDLSEVALTKADGKYKFLPAQEGTYRLSVYAKDVEGNETTRHADFIVETILAGEVFNPASAVASTNIIFNGVGFAYGNNVGEEYISANDNTDETYSGSYMRASAVNHSDVWGNITIKPRLASSEYDSYDIINVWVYVEATATTPVNVLFFNDSDLTRIVSPNQWTLLPIERATFFDHLESEDFQYVIALKFNATTTGIRLGEMLATNVTESENVVFNPAYTSASEQVTYSTVNNTQAFAPANGVLADATYSGAYMRTEPKNTGWFNVILTPKYEISAYDNYDFITAWLYIESTTDEPVNVLFLNDADLTQTLTPNAWVQVKIARSRFMEKVTENYFCAINYGTATAINIGEIVGDNYAETTNLVFEPATADATKITPNNASTVAFTQASANTDTTYSGAYVSVLPKSLTDANKWVNIALTPIKVASSYSNYTHIKVWVYVETGTATDITPQFGQVSYTMKSNQWTDVYIPIADFVANSTKPFFGTNFRNNGTWGITGVRIGEAVAVTKTAENGLAFFNPTSQSLSQVTATGVAFGNGNKATYSYGVSGMENYKGAYVQIDSTALTTSNQTGRVDVTPTDGMSAYSAYTTVKAWIYLKATDTAVKTVYLFGNTSAPIQITSNQWVQIEIPVNETFLQADSLWLQTNLANASTWGVTAIRIGEIVGIAGNS